MRKIVLSLAVLALVASPAFAGKLQQGRQRRRQGPHLLGHPRHHQGG